MILVLLQGPHIFAKGRVGTSQGAVSGRGWGEITMDVLTVDGLNVNGLNGLNGNSITCIPFSLLLFTHIGLIWGFALIY